MKQHLKPTQKLYIEHYLPPHLKFCLRSVDPQWAIAHLSAVTAARIHTPVDEYHNETTEGHEYAEKCHHYSW